MDEIKLLEYRMKDLEKNLLLICKDLNSRLNELEDKQQQSKNGCNYADNIK